MNNKNRSVLIMMTTYNSERFIREQLDSILAQTYENWTLFVRDDGSSDGTPDILTEYAAADPRVRIFKNEGTRGAYPNFHGLIAEARQAEPFDYYMFADHDDVWLPGKIAFFKEKMDRYRTDVPVLLYADMSVVDENGSVTAESLDAQFGLRLKGTWSRFYQHSVFGCNTMMNRTLFLAVPPADPADPRVYILSHDNYFAKYAALGGIVFYFLEVTMQYRRYGTNVTAKNEMTITPKRILARLAAFDNLARDHARTYLQSLYALEAFMPCLSGEKRRCAEELKRSIEKGGIFALYVFLKLHVSCGKKVRTLSRALVLLSGRYRKYMNEEFFR